MADVLERVLDKGIVIAGDITIDLLQIELLTIKLRLLVASADKARELGIDWWSNDPFLSGRSRNGEGPTLRERIDRLERVLEAKGREGGDGRGLPGRSRTEQAEASHSQLGRQEHGSGGR